MTSLPDSDESQLVRIKPDPNESNENSNEFGHLRFFHVIWLTSTVNRIDSSESTCDSDEFDNYVRECNREPQIRSSVKEQNETKILCPILN